MARTLPPGMAANIAAPGQQPSFAVTIQDLIARFSSINSNGPGGTMDALLLSSGTILRATIASASVLKLNRITNPATSSQWDTSTAVTLAADPIQAAGLAIAQTGSAIRIFFRSQNTTNIAYIQSTDDGVTWSAQATFGSNVPILGVTGIAGIAADSTTRVWIAWYAYPNAASAIYRSIGAAWFNEGPASPVYGQVRGLSCVAVSGATYLVAGVQITYPQNGIGVAVTKITGTSPPTYTPWTQIQSMDNPSIGLSLTFPTISYDSSKSTFLVTMTASDDGSLSGTAQTRTTLLSSPDAVTWTPYQELGTTFYGAGAGQPNAAKTIILGTTIYVLDAKSVQSAPAGPSLTDVSDDVLVLHVHEDANRPASLLLVLDNHAGQYNNHPSVRADARISVSFGYSAQLLLTHTFITDTFTYQLGPAISELTIQARNHVKLLDYPQHQMLIYQNQTITQLITAICLPAGVPLATLPTTPQFSTTVPCFVISPGESWLRALERVATIYGFDFFADSTPAIRITQRQITDPNTWNYGTEVFAASYGLSADQANAIRVTGISSTTPPAPVFADAFDSLNILAEGKERFRNVVDRQLDTSAKCAIRGALLLREEQMAATHGALSITINPQHELLDVIQFSDAQIALSNQPLRISSIEWIADPEHGTWEQKLTLSGV